MLGYAFFLIFLTQFAVLFRPRNNRSNAIFHKYHNKNMTFLANDDIALQLINKFSEGQQDNVK